MDHLKTDEIECLYSKLVYDCIQHSRLLSDYPETETLDDVSANNELDRYYEDMAAEDYQELVIQILDGVKRHFH